jgi:hypothetical protein
MHCRDLKKETYMRERERERERETITLHTHTSMHKRVKETGKFLLWTEASFPLTKFKDRWVGVLSSLGRGEGETTLPLFLLIVHVR